MRTCLTLLFLIALLNTNAQVEIYGTATNYKDTTFYITETGGFHNFTMAWRGARAKVAIDKNGQFKASVPEEAINTWYIETGNIFQAFDLQKGDTLHLVADFSKKYPLQAIGKNADEFNYSLFVNDQIGQYVQKESYRQKIRHKSIDSVLNYRLAFSKFKLNLLDEYRHKHTMSDAYYKWLQAKYTYEPFERISTENIRWDSVDETTVSKIMQKGIDDDYAALHTMEYNDLVNFYVNYLSRKNNSITLMDKFSFAADGNLLKGKTRDIYLTRYLAAMFKLPDSLYLPLFRKYDSVVKNSHLKQYVINHRNEYASPAPRPTLNVESSAGALSRIFSKYKGKVIYVDFWASWCAPCRSEMPNAALLKQKLKGKDIVFLYLGYNDKEKPWQKAREQLAIEGEHYLLDQAMMKEANDLFGINGIPHYAIINRDGSIVEMHADRPRDVYPQLVDLLLK